MDIYLRLWYKSTSLLCEPIMCTFLNDPLNLVMTLKKGVKEIVLFH